MTLFTLTAEVWPYDGTLKRVQVEADSEAAARDIVSYWPSFGRRALDPELVACCVADRDDRRPIVTNADPDAVRRLLPHARVRFDPNA